MADCQHTDFEIGANVNFMEDTGRYIADITLRCRQCNLPFSFVGFPSGLSFDRPMVSVDATELRAPIEPGPQPLAMSARFEMPVHKES